MADVLLLHHAQGQTPGFLAFADALRAAGHTVHAPDLYDGKSFATLDEGMANARSIGFESLLEQGVAAAEGLPDDARLCRLLPRRHGRAAPRPDPARGRAAPSCSTRRSRSGEFAPGLAGGRPGPGPRRRGRRVLHGRG